MTDILQRSNIHAADLSRLILNNPDGILVLSAAGVIRYANPAAAVLLARPLASLAGDALALPVTEDQESQIVLPSSQGAITLQLRSAEIEWEGEAARLVTLRDISERVRLEDALRAHAEQFRNMFVRHSAVMLLVEPETGAIVGANEAAAQFYGWSVAELLGTNIDQINALPRPQTALEHQRARLKEAETLVFPHRLANGEIRTVEVHSAPIPLGEKVVLLSVIYDITSRKRAELRLRENESRLKAVIESTGDYIWSIDRDCRLLVANSTYANFIERQIGRAPAIGDCIVAPPYPPSTRAFWHPLYDRALAGEALSTEFESPLLPGRTLECRLNPIYKPDGSIDGVVVRAVDITEKRRHEEDLLIAKQVADAANAAKTEYLSFINHELRTPLNAIIGLTQIMQGDPSLVQSHGDDLATLIESGNHMLSLINEVLDMAKVEAGKAELVARDVDLHTLLGSVQAMLQSKMDAKSLSFDVEIAPGTPRFIRTDEGKLRQVLINLLNNAVKFTKVGGVSLDVWSDENAAERILFRVTDTGSGVAPDQIDRLFKPFVQTDSAHAQQEGTGLGLVISQAYVKLLGGDIAVTSTLGVGSSFQFDIHCPEAAPPEPEVQRQRATGLAPGTPTYRILIVDDVETHRFLMRRQLSPLGFELAEAADGEEALEMWRSWQPHLIFLDIMLPKLDGFEVVRTIRRQEALLDGPAQHTQVVAATASVLHNQFHEIIEAGCDGVLSKPYTRQELLDRVHTALGVDFTYAPASKAQPARSPAATASREDNGPGACRILVVDDNAVNRKVAVSMLNRLGHAAHVAGNGREAITILRSGVYSLVLLDVQMPVMGGLEAARRIREEWGNNRPYLVAVTGGNTDTEQQACREAGMDAWLDKPLQITDLRSILQKVLA